MSAADDWDFPGPHVITLDVLPSDIDAYRHVNNAVYLSWFDRAAWTHSAALGVPIDESLKLRRGMAAVRCEVDYVRAAMSGDRVEVGTWIVASDRRLRVERRFQVRRAPGSETLARALTAYACINLDTGRATRMPPLFSQCYQVTLMR
ncbi:MAG TPA: thioesterase family protein [Steroidobacteraceae bacterium]|nr:thioesterase family protein [Steroidobacteraceae bacterium]